MVMKTSFVTQKVILVTGAAGSIGSALVKKLLSYNPTTVRLFDHDETRIFRLTQEIADKRIRPFIGDIRDYQRLKMALQNVEVVFNTAALKHVPLCEYNPFEAVKTNVEGSQQLIYAIMDTPTVKKALLISTDKAVYPINVMGTTKLLAEKLWLSANLYKGDHPCEFSVARFGNVWLSSGSVGEVWEKEAKENKPLTITDPNAARFFFTIEEATTFLIKALNAMEGGEVFIPRMEESNVMELANKYSDKFNIIGLRAGEKLKEELWTKEENDRIERHKDFYLIKPSFKAKDISVHSESS